MRTATRVGIRGGAALVGTFLLLSSSSAHAAGTTASQAVAILGQAAPGGGTFVRFDEPRTNPAGHVLFLGYTASDEGVYFWDGALHKVARPGDTLPGIGRLGTTWDGPVLNEPDTVALVNYGITSGAATFNAVIHKSKGGSWTFAAKGGQAVPGCTGGPFTFVTFDDIAQNDNNDLAFIGEYTDVASVHHAGVFVKYSLKPVTAVVCDGDTLGSGEGTISATHAVDTDIDGPGINDQGDVVFSPEKVVGGTASNGSGGVYIKPKGMAIHPLVKVGDPGPATIGGMIAATEDSISLSSVGLNNQSIGLRLDITGGSATSVVATRGIASGGALSSCASQGETAPGTGGGTFSGFQAPTLSDNGNLGFSAEVGTTDSIFSCRNGVVTPFVLQGDPRPSPKGTYLNLEESSIGGEEFATDFEIAFLEQNSSDECANPTGVYVG
jgi:hypothetical protein